MLWLLLWRLLLLLLLEGRGRRLRLAWGREVLLFGWRRILLLFRRRRIVLLWSGIPTWRRWVVLLLLLVCGRGCGWWRVGLAAWRRRIVLLLALLVWYMLEGCPGGAVL